MAEETVPPRGGGSDTSSASTDADNRGDGDKGDEAQDTAARPGEPWRLGSEPTPVTKKRHRPITSGSPVPLASEHPEKWGHVESDGTVYVRTGGGERVVGSWQAGTAAEGLAHFARRFDDLRAEVELLHARLAAGSGDGRHTAESARNLRESLPDAAVVGDVDGLAVRLDTVLAETREVAEHARQARQQARAEAVARKEELVAEAERIGAESTQWKAAGDRLRSILDEWKTIKGIDKKTDDGLWKRFSKSREAFNRRRGAHFADLDKQRATAKQHKEELLAEAERLVDSQDWGPTATRYKQLMADWKAAGRAPKDVDDALWQDFRAAQDAFFTRRSSVFSERDAEFAENARRKEALLAEAERIDPDSGLEAARASLQRLQQRWDEIGKVPRERMRELEGRLKTVEDKVRKASDTRWRRTDPEAQARAAQFRERVEQFEAQATKARAVGDDRRAKRAEEQAAQWREWMVAAEQAVATR